MQTPAIEEGITADKERIGSLSYNRSKGRIDFAAGAGANDLHLQPHGATSQLHRF